MPILADQIQSLHVAGSDSELSCGSIRFRAFMWQHQIQSFHVAASDSELAYRSIRFRAFMWQHQIQSFHLAGFLACILFAFQ
jgi:hypothetical protein